VLHFCMAAQSPSIDPWIERRGTVDLGMIVDGVGCSAQGRRRRGVEGERPRVAADVRRRPPLLPRPSGFRSSSPATSNSFKLSMAHLAKSDTFI
jgi:hypothetical protein